MLSDERLSKLANFLMPFDPCMGLPPDRISADYHSYFSAHPDNRKLFDEEFASLYEDTSMSFREKVEAVVGESFESEEEAQQYLLEVYHAATGDKWSRRGYRD